MNSAILTVCWATARYYPSIGNIIRYFGSVTGFFLIFLGPLLTKYVHNKVMGWLNYKTTVSDSCLVLLGLFNLALQIIPKSYIEQLF